MQPINWLDNKWKITCNVTFTRKTPVPGPGYRPHLLVEGGTEYIGVTFLNTLVIGENQSVRFEPLYAHVNFRPLLKRGVKFDIKEGRDTVGTGIVTFVKDKYCNQ